MNTFAKTKILKLLTYFSIVFTPVVPALIWLGLFIAIDLITGVWRAKKQKQAIQSKKLGNTVTKAVMYFLAIIASKVMDTELLNVSFLPFTITQAVVGFISVTEFKSIMENIGTILGMNFWKFITNKINEARNIGIEKDSTTK